MNLSNTLLIVIHEDYCFVTASADDTENPDAQPRSLWHLKDTAEHCADINLGAVSETNPWRGWRSSAGDIFVFDTASRTVMELTRDCRLSGIGGCFD